MNQWLLLVTSLPTRHTAVRMRTWRALNALGAAVLRDGVYLLPARPAARSAFDRLAQEVRSAGGNAQVLATGGVDAVQAAEFRKLFDRSGAYAAILEKAQAARANLTARTRRSAAKNLRRLRREYDVLHAADQFPGPAAEQVRAFLEETQALIEAAGSPGEPAAHPGSIARLEKKNYRGRTWATRARPWVDRLASAWLIKRHVDPRARFLWLKQPKDCPKRALGFDFDDAPFTHVGARVTFETILASFGLEADRALMRLGTVVHFLDVGGAPVAEAAGLESILRGMRARIADDDALLAEAMKLFDHLYRSFSET